MGKRKENKMNCATIKGKQRENKRKIMNKLEKYKKI